MLTGRTLLKVDLSCKMSTYYLQSAQTFSWQLTQTDVLSRSPMSGFASSGNRRQRRRLFPPPEPDLTVVDFRIPRQPNGRPRLGNLAAFLPDTANLNHPRHFHFSFSMFTEYMTQVAGFPQDTKWLVKLPNDEKRFDDRASWLHALKSIARILDTWDGESSLEPELTVEFMPDMQEETGTIDYPMIIKEESPVPDINVAMQDDTITADNMPVTTTPDSSENPSSSREPETAAARLPEEAQFDHMDPSSPLTPLSSITDENMSTGGDMPPEDQYAPAFLDAEATTTDLSAQNAGANKQQTQEVAPPISSPEPQEDQSQDSTDIPRSVSPSTIEVHISHITTPNPPNTSQAGLNEDESQTNPAPEPQPKTTTQTQPQAQHETQDQADEGGAQEELKITNCDVVATSSEVLHRLVQEAEGAPTSTKQSQLVPQTPTNGPSPTNEQDRPLVSLGIDIHEAEDSRQREYTDDEDEDDEPFGNERIAPTQQLLFNQNFLTEEQWIEVCTVLDHPVEERQGKKLLPGTQQSLLIHQMAFIVRAMKCHRTRQELNGLLLADNVGIGKSLCALGLFAVTSLVLLNVRHVAWNPAKHLPGGTDSQRGLACPSGNPYGIQCVCVSESITRDYAQQLVCGPSVLTVPASNLDAWARRITNYFRRHVRAKGSDKDEPMIDPVCYRESGQLSAITVEGRKSMIEKNDIIAKVMASTDVLPSVNDYFGADISRGGHRNIRGQQEPMSYEAMHKEYGDLVRIRFEPPSLDDLQFRFLILVSFSAYGSPKCSLSKILGVRIPFKRSSSGVKSAKQKKHKTIPVQIPFAVAVNLFIFDESHSVTGHDTRLYSNFRDAQRLGTVNRHRRTKWFFMTATPFSHSPNDIFACLDLLVSNNAERERLLEELPIFASRFRRLQSAAASHSVGRRNLPRQSGTTEPADSTTSFARDFANFVRPFTVARDWGSPYLDTVLHDVRPGITRHTVRVSVPRSLQAVVERLGARCRRELIRPGGKGYDELQLKDLEETTIFTQYFSAGIMPGIAAMIEKFDGDHYNSSPDPLDSASGRKTENTAVPASVKQVDEDFRLGKRSVMRKTLRFHQGHDWTLELRKIIHMAHNDRTSREGKDISNPRHILLVAQTPALVGYLTVFLQNDADLKKITEAVRIFQTVTPKPAGRDTFLREVEARAEKSDKSYVLVTTPRLIGVGVDIVFCSYFIQFGEIFSNRDREQLIGRVNRPGQRFPVHFWHIMSTHQSHKDVRNRNNGRSVMLSEHAGREEPEVIRDEEEEGESL